MDFDALVIGGGPAGSTAAIMLANAGWSVALLERSKFPRRKVCGEFLSASTVPLLRELGVADSFFSLAGPEVRRVGLFAGASSVTTVARAGTGAWGRALGREHLDSLLLDRAAAAGTRVWDSCSAVEIARSAEGYACKAVVHETRESVELRSRLVIAAHGSWEPGPLPTQPARREFHASDLFGFKGHFVDCELPNDLMPLVAFPDGYGGMVHSDHGRVSLSCCIRRDRLEKIRHLNGSANAAESVVEHIKRTCEAARAVLARARLEDSWMAAGPIRPGIRSRTVGGVFRIGNAAGEAHPVIAEGITMAMQSAHLLCRHLIRDPQSASADGAIEAVARDYSRAWRRQFAPRIHAAALVAHWAMTPWATTCSVPFLKVFPLLLTAGARWSGKVPFAAQRLSERRS